MKKNLLLWLFAACLLGGLASLSSCKKDDPATTAPSADKAQLTALLDSVNVGFNAAVEGTRPGQYTVGSKATFRTSIDAATGVKNDGAATQTSVNNAVAALRRAVNAFRTSQVQEVSAINLMAQWKFEGNANDATANANNGLLKAGKVNVANSNPAVAVVGTALPTLTTDRFNRPNQAYAFSGGSYIEVPYRTALNPQSITISAWVRRTGTNSDNYIVSLNRWQGYKFQLQGANKPFLTVATTATIADRDADAGTVPDATWTHVATSYTDGTMKFYINGALVKTWTGIAGALKATPRAIPLCIGQQLPNDTYDSAAPAGITDADYFKFYGQGFFVGSLDDIRIYNRPLSDAEVNSIFTIESTL